jgi:hypothetical protein
MTRNKFGFVWVPVILLVVLISIGLAGYYVWHRGHITAYVQPANSTKVPTAPSSGQSPKASEDLTKLPLGDGKVTTTGSKAGYVYSCTSNFRGGGASHSGAWISGDTWDLKAKPTVDGSISWPNASVNIAIKDGQRTISGNGLPVDTMTGIFPIKPGSNAYQYDRNPNSIKVQNVLVTLTANPAEAESPNCLGLGPIGYMTNGVALFNALDDAGRDAAAHEIQDGCDGHPQMAGIYHYHSMSGCIPGEDKNNTLVGYALDGYGIFSDRDASGNQYTSGSLDACHGITSEITWDGKTISMYHYVLTHDYPYSLGCFRGTPVKPH